MGGKAWLGFIGITIACGVAGFVGFMLISGFWYRWGFLGTFLIIAVVSLLAGWIIDRRDERRRSAY